LAILSLPLDRLLNSLGETLVMTAVSGAISFAVGLPLGIILVGTSPGGLCENRWINRVVGVIVNSFRSLPFIILLVALIPLTRLIVGTSIGTAAAIVPLSISGIPYFGRVSEVALREVDRGLIEAVRAMGGGNWDIIREALVPEALPSLLAGFTVTLVLLVGASAMAGAVGAGGLGDLAIRYGYQRFETFVMIAVIVVLTALVAVIQAGETAWRGSLIIDEWETCCALG
jgi:D-methionine transport system permease protein